MSLVSLLAPIRYQRIDPDFIDTAAHRGTTSQLLPVDAATAFATFEDAQSWTVWLGLSSCRWTSATGPGATRIVRNGPVVLGEQFLVWQPGDELMFRFTRGPLPIRRAGERWKLHDLGDGSCRLDWSYAAEGGVAPIFVKQLDAMGAAQLPKLAQYLAERA